MGGQGWDNGEWPILVKGPRSLGDCCKECTKKKGCSGFHIGKLKDVKGDCFLFSHTAITPVKSLGGECYQLKKGKSSDDDDDDDDDGPTEEQCQKYVTKACQKKAAKGKEKQREGDGKKKQENKKDKSESSEKAKKEEVKKQKKEEKKKDVEKE